MTGSSIGGGIRGLSDRPPARINGGLGYLLLEDPGAEGYIEGFERPLVFDIPEGGLTGPISAPGVPTLKDEGRSSGFTIPSWLVDRDRECLLFLPEELEEVDDRVGTGTDVIAPGGAAKPIGAGATLGDEWATGVPIPRRSTGPGEGIGGPRGMNPGGSSLGKKPIDG